MAEIKCIFQSSGNYNYWTQKILKVQKYPWIFSSKYTERCYNTYMIISWKFYANNSFKSRILKVLFSWSFLKIRIEEQFQTWCQQLVWVLKLINEVHRWWCPSCKGVESLCQKATHNSFYEHENIIEPEKKNNFDFVC